MSENTTQGDGKCNEALPPPPIPADADLRGLRWVPIRSTLRDDWRDHSAAVWRAMVCLELAAWGQVPAGSLPSCPKTSGKLAGFFNNFSIIFQIFLNPEKYGWKKHADGRMYHKCMTERVLHELKRQESRRKQHNRDLIRGRKPCGMKKEEGSKKDAPPSPSSHPAMDSHGDGDGGARPRVKAWTADGMRTATSLPALLRAAGSPCNAGMVAEWHQTADGLKLDDLAIILWHSIMLRDPIRMPSGLRNAINAFRAMDSNERARIKAAAASAGVV